MEKIVSRRLSGDWRPSLERFHRWGFKDGTQSDVSQGAVDAEPAGTDATLLRGGRGRGGGPWAELGGLSDVGVGDIRAEVPVAAAIRARRAGTGGVGATSRGGRTCAACSGLSGRRRTCGCASVWTWWTRGSCAGRSRGCLRGRSAAVRWRGSSGWGVGRCCRWMARGISRRRRCIARAAARSATRTGRRRTPISRCARCWCIRSVGRWGGVPRTRRPRAPLIRRNSEPLAEIAGNSPVIPANRKFLGKSGG